MYSLIWISACPSQLMNEFVCYITLQNIHVNQFELACTHTHTRKKKHTFQFEKGVYLLSISSKMLVNRTWMTKKPTREWNTMYTIPISTGYVIFTNHINNKLFNKYEVLYCWWWFKLSSKSDRYKCIDITSF